MPSVTYRFSLPEEQEEFDTFRQAGAMSAAVDEIRNRVFRPARKHGYPDPEIQALLSELGEKGHELVGKLESMFYDILREYEVELR